MNINDILNESDVKADPEIVAKFAGVSDSQRSYYIYQWAKENDIDSDEAMQLAGYKRGSYMGSGSYMWNYSPRESLANEAPAGMMKQMGRRIGAKAAGAIGMKGTAAKLGGAADAGKAANNLKVKLQKYLGKTGGNIKQLDAQELSAFLKQKKLPTSAVPASGIIAPKDIDKVLMKTIQTSNKAAGAPVGDVPQQVAAPQASAPQQQAPRAANTTKIPTNIQAQLDSLTPTEKKVLAGAL